MYFATLEWHKFGTKFRENLSFSLKVETGAYRHEWEPNNKETWPDN